MKMKLDILKYLGKLQTNTNEWRHRQLEGCTLLIFLSNQILEGNIKGTVHPKIKIQAFCIQPHA